MGGPGSGRRPAAVGTRSGSQRLRGVAPCAWVILKRTLARAEKDMQNPDAPYPPPKVLELALWAAEQDIGKATIRMDVQQETKLVLDPSLVMAAIAQAQMDTLALDTEREGSNVIESDWVACEGNDSEKRPFAKCSDTPTEGVE